jgi:hypothetical protein
MTCSPFMSTFPSHLIPYVYPPLLKQQVGGGQVRHQALYPSPHQIKKKTKFEKDRKRGEYTKY